MERFIQVLAGVLLTVLLGAAISKQAADMKMLLTIAVSCMVLAVVIRYLEPVIAFVEELQTAGNLDSEMVRILIKCVGISVVAEITVLVCSDSGNAALGKGIQMLATAVVLWLGLPLLQELLELVQRMLGEL